MSTEVDFPEGFKDLADSYREQYPDMLCSDDDARTRTVVFSSDADEEIVEEAQRAALDAAEETSEGPGQIPLSDSEKDEIDFSQGNANVLHARAVKGIARDEGVDDWTAHYHPTLTVDEHREVMERAAREGRGGRQMDSEDSAVEKAGRAARTAESEQCDHAADHCANGDPDACEFLQSTCGFSEEEVAEMLEPVPDGDEEMVAESEDDVTEGLSGKELGAMKRSWGGYQGAVEMMRESIQELREHMVDAQMAAKAINGIRAENDQAPIHFDELELANAALLDTVRMAAAECEECHARHSEHSHAVDEDEIEDVREFVGGGGEVTPVGVSEDTEEAVEQALDVPEMVAGYELEEHDPHNLVWSSDRHRVEVYSHGGSMDHHYSAYVRHVGHDHDGDEPGLIAEFDDDRTMADDMGEQENRDRAVDAAVDWMRDNPADEQPTQSDSSDMFAAEKQGSLDVGVEQEEVAEETQVTLGGDEASEFNRALPGDWEQTAFGQSARWEAGPLRVEVSDSGNVVLIGPEDAFFKIASSIPEDQATDVARRFTEVISPPDIDFKDDRELQEAAARAKDAIDTSGGLGEFA